MSHDALCGRGAAPRYTEDERAVWAELFTTQCADLERSLCPALVTGFEALALCADALPSCADLSRKLRAATGWSSEPVVGLVPVRAFFRMLSERVFPTNVHVRSREALGFSTVPDLLHEVGHCAMLMNPTFARFAQGLGTLACRCTSSASLALCERVYWFTAEVGLVASESGLRAFGANFFSSRCERDNVRGGAATTRPFEIAALEAMELDIFRVQPVYYALSTLEALETVCLPMLERRIFDHEERCA